MIVIISYCLREPAKNYNEFYDRLRTWCSECRHIMEESWLVKFPDNADLVLVANDLKKLIGDRDFLFISEITDRYAGWLGKSTWEWLNEKFNK